jgi:hypothetical protein
MVGGRCSSWRWESGREGRGRRKREKERREGSERGRDRERERRWYEAEVDEFRSSESESQGGLRRQNASSPHCEGTTTNISHQCDLTG